MPGLGWDELSGQQQLRPALPLSSHVNFAIEEEVKKALDQNSPLGGKGYDEDADGRTAWPIAAKECHQEPEAEQHLDVDIPETWWKRGRKMGLEVLRAGSHPPACWSLRGLRRPLL